MVQLDRVEGRKVFLKGTGDHLRSKDRRDRGLEGRSIELFWMVFCPRFLFWGLLVWFCFFLGVVWVVLLMFGWGVGVCFV